jgi:hypothetical protein
MTMGYLADQKQCHIRSASDRKSHDEQEMMGTHSSSAVNDDGAEEAVSKKKVHRQKEEVASGCSRPPTNS